MELTAQETGSQKLLQKLVDFLDVKDEQSVSGPLVPVTVDVLTTTGPTGTDRTDGGKTRKFGPLGSQRLVLVLQQLSERTNQKFSRRHSLPNPFGGKEKNK